MRSKAILAAAVLLASLVVVASGPQETLEQLKERARSAKPKEAALANAIVVQREVEVANQCFNDGDAEKGQAAVQDALAYAQKSLEAARKGGKKLKRTEIVLREATRRLDDIRRSLAFEDQEPVKKAVDRLEQIRRDLLAEMFDREE